MGMIKRIVRTGTAETEGELGSFSSRSFAAVVIFGRTKQLLCH